MPLLADKALAKEINSELRFGIMKTTSPHLFHYSNENVFDIFVLISPLSCEGAATEWSAPPGADQANLTLTSGVRILCLTQFKETQSLKEA